MEIEIRKLNPDAVIPEYATTDAAGLDLRACIDQPIEVLPGKTEFIPTGIALHIPDPNVACMLLPRSGLGAKEGLVLGNLVGLCDADYQGEYLIAAWNRRSDGKSVTIHPGERIAQAVFVPIVRARFKEVDVFSQATERGEGGFGSSGRL